MNKVLHIFTCLSAFILFSPIIHGQEISDTNIVEKNGRQFYQYVVQPGNTLYSISKLYNVSVHEIEEHNEKAVNGLSIGDTLLILAANKDKQLIEKNLEVDGNILVHEVQKKQTLYAISKIYGIGIGDIIAENPELKDGVKEGQLIRIPIVKLKEEKEMMPLVDEDKYLTHQVRPKETLYSLSKSYQVPIDSIVSANNGLVEGLKEGQIILIPKTAGISSKIDSSIKKEVYNVAFIMPFFLDMNDTLMSKLKITDKERVMSKSLVALQFYEGALIALDSLKKEGKKYKVSFFDSAKDSNAVDKLMDEGKLKNMDLIIGPLYLSEFLRVSAYAKKQGIHIVCPVPQNNKVLLGNGNVSKVATSRNVMFKNLGKYGAHLYSKQNIILVGQNFRINPLVLAFKNEYLSKLQKLNDTVGIKNLREVKWDNGSIDVIKVLLKDSVTNLIVIPSNDQVYVTELLAQLNQLRNKYSFNVLGLDNWIKYTNIDFEYFENLGVMVPSDGFIDYEKEETKRFIRKYHSRYELFPEKFAFQGFDVTYFYLNQLYKEGDRIENSLTEVNNRQIYFKFNFFKTGIESGYENKGTVLLNYRNFQLVEIPIGDLSP